MKGNKMKKTGKWALSVVSKALVVILVILLLPYAKDLWRLIRPDVMGEIRTQSRIIEQKLESASGWKSHRWMRKGFFNPRRM